MLSWVSRLSLTQSFSSAWSLGRPVFFNSPRALGHPIQQSREADRHPFQLMGSHSEGWYFSIDQHFGLAMAWQGNCLDKCDNPALRPNLARCSKILLLSCGIVSTPKCALHSSRDEIHAFNFVDDIYFILRVVIQMYYAVGFWFIYHMISPPYAGNLITSVVFRVIHYCLTSSLL